MLFSFGRLHSFCFANEKEIFSTYNRKYICSWPFPPFLRLCYQVLFLFWVLWEVSWRTFGVIRWRRSQLHHLGNILYMLETLDQPLSSTTRWAEIAPISLIIKCREGLPCYLTQQGLCLSLLWRTQQEQYGAVHIGGNSSRDLLMSITGFYICYLGDSSPSVVCNILIYIYIIFFVHFDYLLYMAQEGVLILSSLKPEGMCFIYSHWWLHGNNPCFARQSLSDLNMDITWCWIEILKSNNFFPHNTLCPNVLGKQRLPV